jgi:hypothetical protein
MYYKLKLDELLYIIYLIQIEYIIFHQVLVCNTYKESAPAQCQARIIECVVWEWIEN